MANSPMTSVLQRLRRAALLPDARALTDGQLLECFLKRRDETAFETLVQRHGPMVLAVCRRILHSHQDAEDAFQATFLVLVRKMASVVPREAVGSWLHGVAYRTALKARTTLARRRKHERRVPPPAADTSEELLWRDLRPLLDQELQRLPRAYRMAVVLCDLEGRSKREAARQLGIAEGTLSSRLARGRERLRNRLVRRGVMLSTASLTLLLAQQATAARVPAATVASLVKAAGLLAAGQATVGGLSANVATLTEGMVHAMLMNRLKTALACLLVVVLLGLSAGSVAYHTLAAEQPSPAATPVPAARNAEAPAAPSREIDRSVDQLPTGPALTPALVGLTKDGRFLVVQQRVTIAEPRTAVTFQRKTVTYYEAVQTLQKTVYSRDQVQVVDADGKLIDPRTLPRLLKEDVLALVAQGTGKIDPLYLRLVREGTLVFVLLPPTPPEAGPLLPAVPAPAPPSISPAPPVQEPPPPPTVVEPPPQVGATERAEKDYQVAEYYAKTGHAGAAAFYFELVCRRYPGQPLAVKAAARLEQLEKQGERKRPPCRIGEIKISGNTKTSDHVIREQLPFVPGQELSFTDLRKAEDNLERLNLFRGRPQVHVEDLVDSGYKDILIEVEEK